MKVMSQEELRDRIKHIRDQDVVGVLTNALNYKDGHEPLFHAAIEEIRDLRHAIASMAMHNAKQGNIKW